MRILMNNCFAKTMGIRPIHIGGRLFASIIALPAESRFCKEWLRYHTRQVTWYYAPLPIVSFASLVQS